MDTTLRIGVFHVGEKALMRMRATDLKPFPVSVRPRTLFRGSNYLRVQSSIKPEESSPESDDGQKNEDLDSDENESEFKFENWREFRARLIHAESTEEMSGISQSVSETENCADSTKATSSWAHPLVKPERGCIVVAHPSAFGKSQQYFFKAVIFLLWHSDEGSYGIILNRPTNYTLDNIAGFQELMPEFAGSPLYLGGDVGASSTRLLHSFADLEGSDEVISGVFVGGYAAAKAHVRSGKSEAKDFRWFARYSGWGPGQLEREVASGVWFLGSCSSDLVLRHTLEDDISLWTDAMHLMGGKYQDIADGLAE